MDDTNIVILNNQVVIMKALKEMPNLTIPVHQELKEKIAFTEARIRLLKR